MNVANHSLRQTIHFDAPNTSSSESSLDDVLSSNSSIMLRGLPMVQLMSLRNWIGKYYVVLYSLLLQASRFLHFSAFSLF